MSTEKKEQERFITKLMKYPNDPQRVIGYRFDELSIPRCIWSTLSEEVKNAVMNRTLKLTLPDHK